MSRKFYDLTAKGREYEKDGQKKYMNLPAGKLCMEDGVPKWISLEWPGVNLMLSVWEQKPRDEAPAQSNSARAKQARGRADDLEDSIPF